MQDANAPDTRMHTEGDDVWRHGACGRWWQVEKEVSLPMTHRPRGMCMLLTPSAADVVSVAAEAVMRNVQHQYRLVEF